MGYSLQAFLLPGLNLMKVRSWLPIPGSQARIMEFGAVAVGMKPIDNS